MARVGLLVALSFIGCAAKKPRPKWNATPGVHRYEHCREVAIDTKNETVTVICPLRKP